MPAMRRFPPLQAQDRSPALPPRLREALRGLPRMAVAFSGGLDSRFLCHAARLCGCDVLAVHARGPHMPPEESEGALAWAANTGLPLLVPEYDPLALPEVAANSRQRCYHCKRGLLASLSAALTARENENAGRAVIPRALCDGTNADDLLAYRPGLQALAEAGVRSPLAEAGLAKEDIRQWARAIGLDRPLQRARPCLLTRLAYGLTPQKDILARLARAEARLAALRLPGAAAAAGDAPFSGGSAPPGLSPDGPLGDFRLRLTPAPLLQAERLPEALRPAVEAVLARYGFTPCDVLLGRDVSGFYDTTQGSPD